MTSSQNPPGIPSPARLEGWLAGHLAEPCELTDIQLILGGRSNLTYRLAVRAESGDQMLVLRRPPLGHVLPTAHDMSREFRVLSALSGTRVPVAAPLAFCDDPEVIGAPFYVMDYVPGVVMRTKADTAMLTRPQATDLSEGLADMLAAIHGVDVAAAGLGDLGRGAGYLRRQLDRWQRQWQLSASGEVPGYERLVARLTAALPAEGETTLVHGDFRLDNVLVAVDPRPRITAVVDWEMATLGDPLADLGLTLVYWTEPGEEGWLNPGEKAADAPGVSTDATATPGFATRTEFAAGYASRTGRDVSGIGYYIAFGYFKLAVVLEGIHARYQQGKTVGVGFEHEGPAVPLLIARAHKVLDAAPPNTSPLYPLIPKSSIKTFGAIAMIMGRFGQMGPLLTRDHETLRSEGASSRFLAVTAEAADVSEAADESATGSDRPRARCPKSDSCPAPRPRRQKPGARSRRACRSAPRTTAELWEVRRPAFAGPSDKMTRHPRDRFTSREIRYRETRSRRCGDQQVRVSGGPTRWPRSR